MTIAPHAARLTLAATLVAAPAIPATADNTVTSPLWFSLDLGAGFGLNRDDYQQQANDAGLNVTVSDTDTARLAWKAGIGWDLWRADAAPFTLATTLEWFDLGEVNLSYSGSVNQSELENLYDGLRDIHPDSGNGLAAGLSGRWQGFEGRLRPVSLGIETGATYWWQTYELNGVDGDVVRTDNSSGPGWYAGLLAGYQLAPQWRLRGGWRLYGLDSEWVQTASLGLAWQLSDRRPGEPGTVPQPQAMPEPAPAIPPLGRPDRARVDQNGEVRIEVLANDRDPNNRPLHVTWAEGSNHSYLRIGEDGRTIIYRHRSGEPGEDHVRYWLSNGETEVGPIPVTVTIRSLSPVPRPDPFSLPAGTAARLDVLDNDTDPNDQRLFITRVSQPEAGEVEVINGTLVYHHSDERRTRDAFDYWVSNGRYESGPVRIELDFVPRDNLQP